MDEFSRFPLVWWGTDGDILNGVVARAGVSNFSPSENHAYNEPGETSTAEWATDTGGKLCNRITSSSSCNELADSHAKGDNVDDETPHEPFVEVHGDVSVSCGFNGLGNLACGDGPAFTGIWVTVGVAVEEPGEYTIDNHVAGTGLSLNLWVLSVHLNCLFRKV